MKNIGISFVLSLVFLAGCTLNSSQEASLNNAMSTYVSAHNNGAVLSYVGVIYPPAVAYYKNKGDSTFHYKFDLSTEADRPLLTDGTILGTKTAGMDIQIKYRFAELEELHSGESLHKIHFALSENDGENWFFIEEKDYFNDTILPQNKRLFE